MTAPSALAVDLDALGDTRGLWNDWLESAASVLEVDGATLPDDRAEAAAALDRAERRQLARAPRTLLRGSRARLPPAGCEHERGAEALADAGRVVGVFTDAPEPLARVALAQLGAARRVSALETGAGARDRLLATLGDGAVVVSSRSELLSQA